MILETKLELYNKKILELTGDDTSFLCDFIVDTKEICAARPSFDDDGEEEEGCLIYLKSGESFIIKLSYNFISTIIKDKL